MDHRVVVTGMGAVTPIGNSVEEFFDNVKRGNAVLILLILLIRKHIL
jgi:3-oxoacyl-(acyl-carrier-protein) synthase